MSLDVELTHGDVKMRQGIYIRRNGRIKELSRREWDKLFPDREPVMAMIGDYGCVYTSNITHNLRPMAKAAGISQHLWSPEEIGITDARQLIEPLQKGLELLESDPQRFKAFDAPNGWGTYLNLVRFVQEYLTACKQNPQAKVSVSK